MANEITIRLTSWHGDEFAAKLREAAERATDGTADLLLDVLGRTTPERTGEARQSWHKDRRGGTVIVSNVADAPRKGEPVNWYAKFPDKGTRSQHAQRFAESAEEAARSEFALRAEEELRRIT